MSVPSQRAVVIGASAGAVQALLAILPILPADYPLPILIAVHVPPGSRQWSRAAASSELRPCGA